MVSGNYSVELPIPLDSYKEFQGGKKITVRIPAGVEVKKNDLVLWTCGSQHAGQAEVIEVKGEKCVIIKIP